MGKKTPAAIVKELFGVRKLARALGITPGAVSKWETIVPAKYHERLLDLARDRRLRLTAEQLICGA